jgi:hypothetical protein
VTVSTPSGTGSSDVVYTVQANPDTTARSTTVVAAGQTHTVNQAGAACTYSIDPTSGSLAAAGGPGQFRVTTQTGCAWTATTSADWITVTSPSGTGTGDVTYTTQTNTTGAARSATIVVGGQTYTVNEAAQ